MKKRPRIKDFIEWIINQMAKTVHQCLFVKKLKNLMDKWQKLLLIEIKCEPLNI